jgi:nucleoside-diphosphate-sugar epimerase
MNIFVTGSEGFIGSHLVEQLVLKGHNVKALVLYNDHNNYGWLDYADNHIKKNTNFILGDIRDLNFINNNTKNIDVIFHLADLISIPYSYTAPFSYLKTNIERSMNIFKACLNNNIQQLIHTSTSEVYRSTKYVSH